MQQGRLRQPRNPASGPAKYCPTCQKWKLRTPVEGYRGTQLDFCSYHYWLMRGKDAGGVPYSLETYVNASGRHGFRTSLPSPKQMMTMEARP